MLLQQVVQIMYGKAERRIYSGGEMTEDSSPETRLLETSARSVGGPRADAQETHHGDRRRN